MVMESLASLNRQLEQAKRDIKILQDLKVEALSEPENFIKELDEKSKVPKLQHISLIPDIDLRPLSERLPRRATTKYDQNLEFILGKLYETQGKKPAKEREVLSSLIPLRTPTPAPTEANDDAPDQLMTVRKKFREITGGLRSASAPALFTGNLENRHLASRTTAAGAPGRGSLFSPQPVKAQSVQFTLPFVPHSAEASREASPLKMRSKSVASSPLQDEVTSTPNTPSERKRKKASNKPEESPHHNLPWTEEERRRLVELMEIYPEEQVNTRRYAKIAAAIGTRTAGQVANRINKLVHKKRRKDGFTGPVLDVEEFIDEHTKTSEEYKEYQRLKRQIELMEDNPDIIVHNGFKCDACGMEPILGPRWRCTKCVEPNAIDLCQECCSTAEFTTLAHRPDHRFLRHSE